MDMNIDAERLKQLRMQRAWSQEHLSEVSGLGVRTIQRIEAQGRASFESARALAAVFELPLAELTARPAATVPPSRLDKARARAWKQVGKFFAAMSLAALSTWAVMTTSTVSAEQVKLDLDMTSSPGNGLAPSKTKSSLLLDEGEETELSIENDLKLVIAARKVADDNILVNVKLLKRGDDGNFEVKSSPAVLVKDRADAEFRIGMMRKFDAAQAAKDKLDAVSRLGTNARGGAAQQDGADAFQGVAIKLTPSLVK